MNTAANRYLASVIREEDPCGGCEHPRVHHGHRDIDGRWVAEPRCFVWVIQDRPPHGCRCGGWIAPTSVTYRETPEYGRVFTTLEQHELLEGWEHWEVVQLADAVVREFPELLPKANRPVVS